MYFFGTDLSQYSNAFGAPREGLHQLRVPGFDLAFIDVFLTVLGAYFLSSYMRMNFLVTTVMLFGVGFFLHWCLCVPTALNLQLLGVDFDSSQNIHFP